MRVGRGQITEIFMDGNQRAARLVCPAKLIPAPGQYLLAGDIPESPLPFPLFYTESAPQGFLVSSPIPELWMPGKDVFLRGPLGRGFALPASARRVALVAYDDTFARLRGLISLTLKQNASIALVCESRVENVDDAVEVHPLSALSEIIDWADYIGFDLRRENLFDLRGRLANSRQARALEEAQVLVHTQMPCGGVAECGVCAVTLKSGWKMACKDGPVFPWQEI